MSYLNKFFITIISFMYLCLPAFAVFDIDTSVDSQIRKKYNTKKIEQDLLPDLPNNLKNDVPIKSNEDFTNPEPVKTNNKTQSNTIPSPKTSPTTLKEINIPTGQKITLKRGTKLTVRSTSSMSDKMREGAKIYFRLTKPIKTKNFYLSENTRFIGVVVDSHTPQLTGNGGLLVIKVDNITINGKTQEINAKITKANYKKIFFNNIKGKRSYLKNIVETTKPGKKFYDKMWASTKKFANKKITFILSPFTLITGVTVYGVNLMGSPIFAMFSKGGSISIPANSAFEIKLLEDTTLYN